MQAVVYLTQQGIWLDGALLERHAGASVESCWQSVATDAPDWTTLCNAAVAARSLVVHSGESERRWCLSRRQAASETYSEGGTQEELAEY